MAGLLLTTMAQADTASDQPPSASAAAPVQDLEWRLSGLVAGPDVREALFSHGSETRSLSLGRQIDGWTLVSIGSGSVVMASAGQTRVLKLQEQSGIESGRSLRPTAAQVRAADDAAMKALVKQADEQHAGQRALQDLTAQMLKQKDKAADSQP